MSGQGGAVRQATIMSGAVGGGYLLAGFGPLWAVVGMILGATAGYVVERHLSAQATTDAGEG